MWIKRQVVMLPTEKALSYYGQMSMLQNGKLHRAIHESPLYNLQHLYILSDEEIKEGDWYYQKVRGLVEQIAQLTKTDIDSGLYTKWRRSMKKIIATTSLLDRNYNLDRQLPQPSQDFIKVFVEEYNKGNIITEVMVEYEQCVADYEPNGCDFPDYIEKLKIDPKDNTISIRKIKDSWNKEEIIELFMQCNHDLRLMRAEDIREWIKQNI